MKRFAQAVCRRALLMLALALFWPGATPVRAATSDTNWNGLVFGFILPRTNFVAGDRIIATMIVSNALLSECSVSSLSGDPCRAGFGEFLIINQANGQRVECAVSMSERVQGEERVNRLIWHEYKMYDAELVHGYALTRPGTYSVQAVARFRLVGAPDQICDAVTPPLYINLTSPPDTHPAPIVDSADSAVTNQLSGP